MPQAGGRPDHHTVIWRRCRLAAGKPYAYWRTPGLRPWGTSGGANYRGALLVNNLIYAVIDNNVWTFPQGGGAGTMLTGSVPGISPGDDGAQ